MDQAHKNIGKLLHLKSSTPRPYTKRPRKLKPHGNSQSSSMSKKKLVDFLTNSKKKDLRHRNATHKSTKPLSKPYLVRCENQNKHLAAIDSVENAKCEKGGITSEKPKHRRKRKRTKNKVEVDEASRLQRRTRYLLIKMRIEQNLLDAYSTEGWKGQSREKIKPEKELQKAKKQILKCKLGIRDAIRQLDLLSSDGCIDESVIAPDGSVHHDHIHCAKCKLREAFPDNDIILCDGTCNCAYHQMCIDPPLLTENIPPGDQGWFCKYCLCKTEIIEAMNAHLGTSYSNGSKWQEIFKVEATLPDGGDTFLNQEDWPSDESGDDDYDPDRVEKCDSSCSSSGVRSGGESSSFDDDDNESRKSRRKNMGLESTSGDFMGTGSGSGSECEIMSGRRKRRAVDYRKLYDEMFGKDALANEQVSEDEDWGPTNKKRREKESDAASTLMALCETEEKGVDEAADTTKVETNLLCTENKRSFFRIPMEAVEKLRLVFAKNELPSRAVKEELSKQLGLDPEKVNKWFKNARYLSLKTRKDGEENPTQNDFGSEVGKVKATDEMLSEDMLIPMVDGDGALGGDDVSLKMIRQNTKKDENITAATSGGSDGDDDQQAAAEAQMEKLCMMKTKLEKLQQVLVLRFPNRRAKNTAPPSNNHRPDTIFVPIAHLKEKP